MRNFEDAEGLIQNQLIINTLFLGFIVNEFHSNELPSIINADERIIREYLHNGNDIQDISIYSLFSTRYEIGATVTSILIFLPLMVTAACYGALMYFDCRTQPRVYNLWRKTCGYLLAVDWTCLAFGILSMTMLSGYRAYLSMPSYKTSSVATLWNNEGVSPFDHKVGSIDHFETASYTMSFLCVIAMNLIFITMFILMFFFVYQPMLAIQGEELKKQQYFFLLESLHKLNMIDKEDYNKLKAGVHMEFDIPNSQGLSNEELHDIPERLNGLLHKHYAENHVHKHDIATDLADLLFRKVRLARVRTPPESPRASFSQAIRGKPGTRVTFKKRSNSKDSIAEDDLQKMLKDFQNAADLASFRTFGSMDEKMSDVRFKLKTLAATVQGKDEEGNDLEEWNTRKLKSFASKDELDPVLEESSTESSSSDSS